MSAMSAMPKTEGVGLMLNRRVGSKVIIKSNPDATDEEVLDAIKEGIVLTVVGVDKGAYQKPEGNSIQTANDAELNNGQARHRQHNRSGIARIGIKAGSAIYIAREELLLRAKKVKETVQPL